MRQATVVVTYEGWASQEDVLEWLRAATSAAPDLRVGRFSIQAGWPSTVILPNAETDEPADS